MRPTAEWQRSDRSAVKSLQWSDFKLAGPKSYARRAKAPPTGPLPSGLTRGPLSQCTMRSTRAPQPTLGSSPRAARRIPEKEHHLSHRHYRACPGGPCRQKLDCRLNPPTPTQRRASYPPTRNFVLCTPSSSKFPSSSQRSYSARIAGHSPSIIEYQAVSRLSPFTIRSCRKTPSN